MNRIFPQCLDPNPSDRSLQADVFLRDDEEEEEEEDEGDGKENGDDDDDDDGYSE